MSGYTLSALGSSSASAKAFVTEELSPIQSPSAATKFENSGLMLGGWCLVNPAVERLLSVCVASDSQPCQPSGSRGHSVVRPEGEQPLSPMGWATNSLTRKIFMLSNNVGNAQ